MSLEAMTHVYVCCMWFDLLETQILVEAKTFLIPYMYAS